MVYIFAAHKGEVEHLIKKLSLRERKKKISLFFFF